MIPVSLYQGKDKMTKTKEWADALGINTQDILPPSEDNNVNYVRTAEEVAARTVILHSIVAAGSGIDRSSISQWLKDKNLWDHASPHEQTALLSPMVFREDRSEVQWFQESQWALLWTIQKVKILGLPIKTCDSIRLVDDIMPVLGGDIDQFVSTSEFRAAAEINAEIDRIKRIYYHARQAADRDEMPEDLIYGVIYHRYYAFRWLTSDGSWDDVSIDEDELDFQE